MYCFNCGAQLPDHAAFCTACGAKTSGNDQHNMDNPAGERGSPDDIPVGISPKSRGKAIVLCVLCFFGFGGIHRFYTGKIVTGIIHFFTFGLCFVGCIVDLVALSKGTFKDSKGLALTGGRHQKTAPDIYAPDQPFDRASQPVMTGQPASTGGEGRRSGARIIKPMIIALVVIALLAGSFFLFGYKPYRYARAVRLMNNATLSSDYQKAADIFTELGDYKESEDHLRESLEMILKIKAETMVSLHVSMCTMWLGGFPGSTVDLHKAWEAYGDLLEYAGNDLRHFDIYERGLEHIAYLLAEYCFENERYSEAIVFYELAHDYEDAEAKLEKCRQLDNR